MRIADLLARLDRDALARRQAEADRVITAALAGHLVHRPTTGQREDAPWRLDPIPLVLERDEFAQLAAGVRQRMEGMEALLADLYGPRQVVREGIVPAEALASSRRYRLAVVGAPTPPRWLTSFAVDVVACTDGSWRVVQDLADTPTGVGYAQLDRSVMGRLAAELLGPAGSDDLVSIAGFPAELRHGLATVTPVASPRIVLLTSGIGDAAYVEHSALARLLGFHLVEAADLVVRSGRLWLRVLGGLDPIDVVYRRRSDVSLDPIEVSATGSAGVPGLTFAAAEGGVVLANAHGSGVLEDPALAPFWVQAIFGLTGRSLTLPELGAQRPSLTRQPAFRDGDIGASAVVVRLHAVARPEGITVMAGGNGRVLADGDDPRRPTARVAKDVWVVGNGSPVPIAPPLPQVDLAASVPTRVADAMYWLGTAAERAEAIARTARAVASRHEQDPALALLADGRWANRMVALLRHASGGAQGESSTVDEELVRARAAVGARLDALVASAATVGEYLSGTTGRVLGGLAESRCALDDERMPIDALDAVLVDLAALAGLWAESVVRGSAWRFGDLGRRVERSLVVLRAVDATVGRRDGAAGSPLDPADVVDASALEVLLAANESLVAYRRRYRSDVQLVPAIGLLLLDQDNPRSFAAATARLAEHVAAIGWVDGERAVAELRATVDASDPLAGLGEAMRRVRAFHTLMVERWFATPVEPVLVRSG
ncbi:MAG: circularly permuted type 2 ATP-grasp protein [Ilumatobacteraceae bacterium]